MNEHYTYKAKHYKDKINKNVDDEATLAHLQTNQIPFKRFSY